MSRYPQLGTVLFGKYQIVSLIGEGGMGVVLKAKHLGLEEDVAIKCLLPDMMDRADIVARFLREAKAAVKLKGEHVARVLDVGRLPSNNVPFIVMEYLEGADLNVILKHHGAQEPSIAVDLILQACEAIAEAHSLGIIHRDIKASNFFITQHPGQPPQLKVLDFGIATAPEGPSELTTTQSVIGTPAYMAPEQMRSSKISDERSDIWSIGVVLYELIEGARPFRSEVYSELCLKVGMDPPIAMKAALPDGLRAIVLRCLEKPLERRYQSVAELAFDLVPFSSDQVSARAQAEQCARLLSRRTSSRDPDDRSGPFRAGATPSDGSRPATPIPGLRPTPSPRAASGEPVKMLLGHPTPPPSPGPRTPTSIQASSGQLVVAADVRPRRRGVLIALTSASLIGAGLAVVSTMGRSATETARSEVQPASHGGLPAEALTPPSEPPAVPNAEPGPGSSQAPPTVDPLPSIDPTATVGTGKPADATATVKDTPSRRDPRPKRPNRRDPKLPKKDVETNKTGSEPPPAGSLFRTRT